MYTRRKLLFISVAILASIFELQNSSLGKENDPSFYDTAQEEFPKWDLNHDGILTGREVLRNFQNPQVKGRSAAAIAVLQQLESAHAHKGHQEPLETFTLDQINHFDERRNEKGQLIKPEKSYERYLKRIDTTSLQLFAHEVPHLDELRQNGASDCYFLAAVGALAHQRPEDLARLIDENEDGSFTVHFYGEEPIHVNCPSPSELSAYSCAPQDGIWFPVIAKAYGKRQLNNHWRKTGVSKDLIDPIEATALIGGNCAPVIALLTGHGTKMYRADSINGDLRKRLAEAFNHHHLVTVGVPGHAMTGMGYDESTDQIQIWNPWGTSGNYKALDVKMSHGLLSMPLPDFMRKCTSIIIESSSPAGENHGKRKQRIGMLRI